MGNIIEITNLSYEIDGKRIFDSLNMFIKRGSWTTILGKNGSGKTLLANMISGIIFSNDCIRINDITVNKSNIRDIRMLVSYASDNPNRIFVSDTVTGNLSFALENLGYDHDMILSIIQEISYLLKIESLLPLRIDELSGGEKQLISLAISLVLKPSILILDDALSMVDSSLKKKVYASLKKLNSSGLTIINITHDVEDAILGDEVVLLSSGKIICHDRSKKVLSHDKLLKLAGYDLPFMVSLSKKLSYYHLVDDIIYDMNEMVNLLWK